MRRLRRKPGELCGSGRFSTGPPLFPALTLAGMRIALASDEPYAVHNVVLAELKRRGHEVLRFGAIRSGKEEPWADVAAQAAQSVASGENDEGIFFCWTGTGICMAANKVFGVRAALCGDPGTAAGARIWNHANVLCLSNRTLSSDMSKEILAAWFDTERGDQGTQGVEILRRMDAELKRGR